ncbi:MAG TPA: S8 family serine peptidase, partial [Gemmatimonadaceae bacterium]|nr:S8 family serine peptidase [Gemmatimonadaceae bacterium]
MAARAATIMRQLPVTDAKVSPAMLAVRFRVLDSTAVDSVVTALRADSTVEWVTRDHLATVWSTTTRHVPSPAMLLPHPTSAQPGTTGTSAATRFSNAENFFTQFWAHNMVDLPRAWAITTGSPAVTIAVVDMGIRPDSPDIVGNLTTDGYDFVSAVPVTEYGLSTPQNICLPDGSGTVIGTFTTFAEDSGPHSDPTDPDDIYTDPYGYNCWDRSDYDGDHGLWTAGIIAATGAASGVGFTPGDIGSVGFVGVNWTAKIRAIRSLDVSGEGEYFDIAQGILYAAGLPAAAAGCTLSSPVVGGGGCLDQAAGPALVQTTRAPIINMSFGGPDDPTLRSAINAAANAGCLLVASAGNESTSDFDYPAGYSN